MSVQTSLGVAVVTGASAGIGAVYADRLAKRGYDLVLVARRGDRLKTLAETISQAHGRTVETVAADLSDEADLARVEALLSARSDITVLVNNAGLARLAPLTTAPAADSLAQIALNITALTRLTQAVLPGFVERRAGTLINIASVMAFHAMPISAVYSGSKAFVLTFTRGLQAELAETGIRVQAVLPAATASEIWDLSGVPLAALEVGTVMTTDHLVDAALAGLDQGELVTLASVADATLWDAYDAARTNLFAASQTSKPAPRYVAA
ncbi:MULTISPECIES: SDR family NAD(P)-dependent oxidoreductase [unclassified Aureimonas]|uniref:SDR family NAD(P)-dependent oxidoreductase n=1 Tax=unclassified Aureimonas TaxID=2615206 RepID=UPI0007017FF5|nr:MULTISPECIES: SDR family oxidoreductase [unclassified Aureimonas]KQT57576.1 AraC family transcriptional regulator [Aureimonas sp. Leaf427]KQT77257.1 AraC family transcriptional regulator [Aureimonas sp. Leaf460]